MSFIFPDKLKAGDEVRVISPSRSLSIISEETRRIANERFDELGLKLSFGKHVEEIDDFNSSSVASRLEDLHEAFADPNVKGILTVVGGFNSNQLLRGIDWELIKANPKIFCGFSDITALNNSILAKTGLVTYSGIHYSTFGMKQHFDYLLEYFQKAVMSDEPIDVKPSKEWTDDLWFLDQENRKPIPNEGWLVIHEGQAEGSIRGGNLCTFNLLQGTEYMPDLNNTILFLEDDEESLPHHFDRNLVSLIQQPSFSGVKAIVIGRFQGASKMTNDLLLQMIESKAELKNIPVIANVDFGHTNTIITYPIGGEVDIKADNNMPSIVITKH
ncbi:MAG: peptidase [Candidatus Saccharibacteria bacterium]|nr:peptidase [Candidatus Saccharibacteria bacterium]